MKNGCNFQILYKLKVKDVLDMKKVSLLISLYIKQSLIKVFVSANAGLFWLIKFSVSSRFIPSLNSFLFLSLVWSIKKKEEKREVFPLE